ncbi:MAG: hypothetical protein ACM3TN_24360 [Alphaproteobacteria bacterium]
MGHNRASYIPLAAAVCLIAATVAFGALIPTASAFAGAEERQAQYARLPAPVQRAAHLVLTGQLPLYFVENRGQKDPRVAYYVQGLNKIIYFSVDGMTFVLHEPRNQASLAPMGNGPADSVTRVVVKLDFVGASLNVIPRGEQPTAARISYFKAAPEGWTKGAKTYARLLYADLWPGIDLVYS